MGEPGTGARHAWRCSSFRSWRGCRVTRVPDRVAALAARRWEAAHRAAEDDTPVPQSHAVTFARLGYEPICKPRVLAAKAGAAPPPPCGRCPQERYHRAGEYDVLYGGAAGPGKTKALLMGSLAEAMEYPGMAVLLVRRSYPELAESLLRELKAVHWAEALGARWHSTDRELSLPNRSLLRFRYAETDTDAGRRLGGEYQRLVIDERQQMAPEVVALLEERLRSGDPAVPVLGIRSACNPGDIGHATLKARYVDATDHGRRVATDPQGRTVRFIAGMATDNPHLDDGYLATLDAIPDPARRAAMRDGSWDSFVGQFFATWRHDRHVVEPFAVPDAWGRWVGIDYGYAAPWAVVWAAVDGDGRVWAYRELYESGVGQTDQARRILAAEEAGREVVRTRAADPSMWSRQGQLGSNAQVYLAAGCHIVRANNDRVSGWARVQHYLADMAACDLHRAAGWGTCPRLHVFSSLPNLIRTLPALPRDKRRPEDVDTSAEDHMGDALRYLLLALPVAGEVRTVPARHRGRAGITDDLLTIPL